MELAVFISLFILTSGIWVLYRRPRYTRLSCLASKGKLRERIIKLDIPKVDPTYPIFARIVHEVRLFNSFRAVMPTRGHVAIAYLDELQRLLQNPRVRPTNDGEYSRLMYLYACINLYNTTADPLVRRQLVKNCLYAFVVTNIIKKQVNVKTHGRVILAPTQQPEFQYLHGSTIHRIIDAPPFELRYGNTASKVKFRHSPSYTTYATEKSVIKHYVDNLLAAECFEIAGNECTMVFPIAPDKSSVNITHTRDTFYICAPGDCTAVHVHTTQPKTFGSSLAEKGTDLKIYLKLSAAKVFIVRGRTKSELVQTIGVIKSRGHQLDYLYNNDKAQVTRTLAKLIATSRMSKYLCGEELRSRHHAAAQIIPSLHLPTIVYTVETPQEFFAVADTLPMFEQIAPAQSMNIVIMYSSLHDNMQNVVNAFSDGDYMHGLITRGVLVFFVDKVNTDADVVYYLSRMSDAATHFYAPKNLSTFNIQLSTNNSHPITHTLSITNQVDKTTKAQVVVPIHSSDDLVVATKRNNTLTTTTLHSGRVTTYKLPPGCDVLTTTGTPIAELQAITDRLFLSTHQTMLPRQQKSLAITKNFDTQTPKQRRQELLGSLTDITVDGNPHLARLLSLPVDDMVCDKTLECAKAAVKHLSSHMFFAVFERSNSLPANVRTWVINRVVGVKTLRGKIHLAPCIHITGDFEIKFTHKNIPYRFSVTERNGRYAIDYGENPCGGLRHQTGMCS